MSYEPLTKKERENTERNRMSLRLGPVNSASPNLLLSIDTKEKVTRISKIQTKMFERASSSGPKYVPLSTYFSYA